MMTPIGDPRLAVPLAAHIGRYPIWVFTSTSVWMGPRRLIMAPLQLSTDEVQPVQAHSHSPKPSSQTSVLPTGIHWAFGHSVTPLHEWHHCAHSSDPMHIFQKNVMGGSTSMNRNWKKEVSPSFTLNSSLEGDLY